MGSLCSQPRKEGNYEDPKKRNVGIGASVYMVDTEPVKQTVRGSFLNQDAMTPYLRDLKLDKDSLK